MQRGGENPKESILDFITKYPDCILISDEIGNGIVPMDAFEREYREQTGRILIELAKEAEEVTRVICGIGQKNQIEIIFLRHGMTIENEQHRYLGEYRYIFEQEWDRKLQALQKNGTYPKTDILFCSPMKRCTETAEILYPNHTPIYIPEWREMDFGEFEGKNYIELQKNPNYQAWIDSNGTLPFPGGESREAFYKALRAGILPDVNRN